MLRLQAGIVRDDRLSAKGLLIATAYQWLKAESDAALFRLQAEAIAEINKSLVDLPPAHLVQGDKSGVS